MMMMMMTVMGVPPMLAPPDVVVCLCRGMSLSLGLICFSSSETGLQIYAWWVTRPESRPFRQLTGPGSWRKLPQTLEMPAAAAQHVSTGAAARLQWMLLWNLVGWLVGWLKFASSSTLPFMTALSVRFIEICWTKIAVHDQHWWSLLSLTSHLDAVYLGHTITQLCHDAQQTCTMTGGLCQAVWNQECDKQRSAQCSMTKQANFKARSKTSTEDWPEDAAALGKLSSKVANMVSRVAAWLQRAWDEVLHARIQLHIILFFTRSLAGPDWCQTLSCQLERWLGWICRACHIHLSPCLVRQCSFVLERQAPAKAAKCMSNGMNHSQYL